MFRQEMTQGKKNTRAKRWAFISYWWYEYDWIHGGCGNSWHGHNNNWKKHRKTQYKNK